MIFYGNGIVWDAEKDRRLCKFKDGKYETDDPREIKILKQVQERQEKLSPANAKMRRTFDERWSKMILTDGNRRDFSLYSFNAITRN